MIDIDIAKLAVGDLVRFREDVPPAGVANREGEVTAVNRRAKTVEVLTNGPAEDLVIAAPEQLFHDDWFIAQKTGSTDD